MTRRTLLARVLAALAAAAPLAGCAGEDKAGNPDNLPYNKDGPPPRNGVPDKSNKRRQS